MIVVDTNIIAYLYLDSEHTARAEALLQKDPEWPLHRYGGANFGTFWQGACAASQSASRMPGRCRPRPRDLMAGSEHDIDSHEVLKLVRDSDCSAYDCEFVALAEQLGVKLV